MRWQALLVELFALLLVSESLALTRHHHEFPESDKPAEHQPYHTKTHQDLNGDASQGAGKIINEPLQTNKPGVTKDNNQHVETEERKKEEERKRRHRIMLLRQFLRNAWARRQLLAARRRMNSPGGNKPHGVHNPQKISYRHKGRNSRHGVKKSISSETSSSNNKTAGPNETSSSNNQTAAPNEISSSNNQTAGPNETSSSNNQTAGQNETSSSNNQTAGQNETSSSNNQRAEQMSQPVSTKIFHQAVESRGSMTTITNQTSHHMKRKKSRRKKVHTGEERRLTVDESSLNKTSNSNYLKPDQLLQQSIKSEAAVKERLDRPVKHRRKMRKRKGKRRKGLRKGYRKKIRRRRKGKNKKYRQRKRKNKKLRRRKGKNQRRLQKMNRRRKQQRKMLERKHMEKEKKNRLVMLPESKIQLHDISLQGKNKKGHKKMNQRKKQQREKLKLKHIGEETKNKLAPAKKKQLHVLAEMSTPASSVLSVVKKTGLNNSETFSIVDISLTDGNPQHMSDAEKSLSRLGGAVWSGWSGWGPCSKPCNSSSSRNRTRHCITLEGITCSGSHLQFSLCSQWICNNIDVGENERVFNIEVNGSLDKKSSTDKQQEGTEFVSIDIEQYRLKHKQDGNKHIFQFIMPLNPPTHYENALKEWSALISSTFNVSQAVSEGLDELIRQIMEDNGINVLGDERLKLDQLNGQTESQSERTIAGVKDYATKSSLQRRSILQRGALWSSWSPWSVCNKPCGTSSGRERKRSCISLEGLTCEGKYVEERHCTTSECKLYHMVGETALPSIVSDASISAWMEWGDWSVCSVTCGAGDQVRTRKCLMTNIQDEEQCAGEHTQHQPCIFTQCKQKVVEVVMSKWYSPRPTWSNWLPWSNCSAHCGLGTETRQRTCELIHQDGKIIHSEASACNGGPTEMERQCQIQSCDKWKLLPLWIATVMIVILMIIILVSVKCCRCCHTNKDEECDSEILQDTKVLTSDADKRGSIFTKMFSIDSGDETDGLPSETVTNIGQNQRQSTQYRHQQKEEQHWNSDQSSGPRICEVCERQLHAGQAVARNLYCTQQSGPTSTVPNDKKYGEFRSRSNSVEARVSLYRGQIQASDITSPNYTPREKPFKLIHPNNMNNNIEETRFVSEAKINFITEKSPLLSEGNELQEYTLNKNMNNFFVHGSTTVKNLSDNLIDICNDSSVTEPKQYHKEEDIDDSRVKGNDVADIWNKGEFENYMYISEKTLELSTGQSHKKSPKHFEQIAYDRVKGNSCSTSGIKEIYSGTETYTDSDEASSSDKSDLMDSAKMKHSQLIQELEAKFLQSEAHKKNIHHL